MSMPNYAPQEHGQPYPGPQDHGPVYPSGDPILTPVVQTAPPVNDEIIDFTPQRPRPQFKAGGETYSGKIEVPALAAMRYSIRAQSMGEGDFNEETLNTTLDLLRLMLTKESADRLIARLEDDENPIGMETFNKIIPWLMEQYGMRPTTPSPDSPNGSPNPDDGMNSTGNSQPTE